MDYLEFGDASGPVAVVVPGLSDGMAPLFHDPAAQAVQSPPPAFRRYRTFVVSHRRPLAERTTTRDLADDLAGFVESVAGSAAAVVGHSMGGMVAQHLAASRGDLVERLALSATLLAADDVFERRLRRWEAYLEQGDWSGFERDAIDASFTGIARWRKRLAVRVSPSPPPGEGLVRRHLALSRACRTHDARREAGSITCPTVVVSGTGDVLTRPGATREVAARIPDAVFVPVERAGHGLPDQRPRAYARALDSFLSRTGAAA